MYTMLLGFAEGASITAVHQVLSGLSGSGCKTSLTHADSAHSPTRFQALPCFAKTANA